MSQNQDLHIVTVATGSKYYFPYLIESCKQQGRPLEVIGFEEEWQGFNWKFKKMMEYLKGINPNDIVCFVDGYDVICCRDLDEMVPVFLRIKEQSGCKMIVAHEKLFSINNLGIFYFDHCKKLSLNSGTYIAYAKDMLSIVEKIYNLNPKDDADDQVLLTQYCKKTEKGNDIYIDEKNELFLTISHSLNDLGDHVTFKNNSVEYNGSRPFFIHAPGFGYLDNIVVQLGYTDKCNIRDELFYNFFREKCLLYLSMVFNIRVILILFLIILIILFLSFLFYNKLFIWKNIKKYIK